MPQPCNCEDRSHFDAGISHPYLHGTAGDRVAMYVGPVCDFCARTHMAAYLYTPAELTTMRRA